MGKNIEYIHVGQIVAYCEQVNAGTKLCAQMMFHSKYMTVIKNAIRTEKCKAVYFNEGKNFKNVFIYKYDSVRFLIYELVKWSKKNKPDVIEIWATGKIFGYSDCEILRFLKKHGYLCKDN